MSKRNKIFLILSIMIPFIICFCFGKINMVTFSLLSIMLFFPISMFGNVLLPNAELLLTTLPEFTFSNIILVVGIGLYHYLLILMFVKLFQRAFFEKPKS